MIVTGLIFGQSHRQTATGPRFLREAMERLPEGPKTNELQHQSMLMRLQLRRICDDFNNLDECTVTLYDT